MAKIKSQENLRRLRRSGDILTTVLKELRNKTSKGVSLMDLEKYARNRIKDLGGSPAFLGYKPSGSKKAYPASICTSVNNVVVHGIPNDYNLKEGDILSIDMGVDYEGLITDSALTVLIGKVSSNAELLVSKTREALNESIKVCKAGESVKDIGRAVEKVVKGTNFKIIKNLTGHGVGFNLHEEPTIFNYEVAGDTPKIENGMVLALEPMLSFSSNFAKQREDGSFVTEDGSPSAHFEVTLLVSQEENEILTPWWSESTQ
ncbi:MAG: type I methionyl aminopeptidase [Candidatus Magasanikbacteria bacterium]